MQSHRIQLGYPAGITGTKAGTTIIMHNDTGLGDEPGCEGGGDKQFDAPTYLQS